MKFGIRNLEFLFLVLCFFFACRSSPEESGLRQNPPVIPAVDTSVRVNLAHLEHLYDEIILPNGDMGGVVWIYCEAPDYVLVGDDDEGYTCVDDMARALVVYAMHHELYGDTLSRKRVNQLSRTIVSMQADNGYFYNFLWPGDSINTTFRTSLAVADWWSWRALWALETALAQNLLDTTTQNHTQETTSSIADLAKIATARVVFNVRRDLAMDSLIRDTVIHNIHLPNDLPVGGGADQVAVLMLGLAKHAERTTDTSSYGLLRGFAERLIAMQTAEGQFLSWYNHWHAWGNMQAYALLEVGRQLQQPSYIAAAMREVDSFTKSFLVNGRYASSQVTSRSITTQVPGQLPQFLRWERDTFPQIAYGQRPMVWAAVAAAEQTNDTIYLIRARNVLKWFNVDNPAGIPMYDPRTGRGYDGIVSAQKVNYNAGAESTIEALLSLLMLEKARNGG